MEKTKTIHDKCKLNKLRTVKLSLQNIFQANIHRIGQKIFTATKSQER